MSVEELLLEIRQDSSRKLSVAEKESLNLYYVASTRALKKLSNATHLMDMYESSRN